MLVIRISRPRTTISRLSQREPSSRIFSAWRTRFAGKRPRRAEGADPDEWKGFCMIVYFRLRALNM